MLPIAMAVIGLWVFAATRAEAFWVAFSYYALATLDLVESAAVFFDPAAPRWALGALLWLGANALLASVWAASWSGSVRMDVTRRLLRGALCSTLLALPPVGLVGWANPWTGTGVVLPGAGFSGLALIHLVLLGGTQRTLGAHVAALFLASMVCCGTYEGPRADSTFGGQSTSFGRIDLFDTEKQFEAALQVEALLQGRDERVVLLPESVGGVWTASTELLWEMAVFDGERTLLVGAVERTAGGYRNGLVVMGPEETWFFAQRVPVPLGMWAPWSRAHVEADVFGRSIHELEGHRVTLLMCYEQLIVWPFLQSAAAGAEIALAPANLWFSEGTRVNEKRAASLRAWARLFRWVRVEAINA